MDHLTKCCWASIADMLWTCKQAGIGSRYDPDKRIQANGSHTLNFTDAKGICNYNIIQLKSFPIQLKWGWSLHLFNLNVMLYFRTQIPDFRIRSDENVNVRPESVFHRTITPLTIRIIIYIICMRFVFQFQVHGTTVEYSHIQVPHILQRWTCNWTSTGLDTIVDRSKRHEPGCHLRSVNGIGS